MTALALRRDPTPAEIRPRLRQALAEIRGLTQTETAAAATDAGGGTGAPRADHPRSQRTLPGTGLEGGSATTPAPLAPSHHPSTEIYPAATPSPLPESPSQRAAPTPFPGAARICCHA